VCVCVCICVNVCVNVCVYVCMYLMSWYGENRHHIPLTLVLLNDSAQLKTDRKEVSA
jgi:hypothetical protein